MNKGDLCAFCLRPECTGELTKCPNRVYVPQPANDAPPAIVMCMFCAGSGGLRVPCHGCGQIGPVR
jgi:hypothetical protein